MRIGIVANDWTENSRVPGMVAWNRLFLPATQLARHQGHHIVMGKYLVHNSKTGELAVRDLNGKQVEDLDVIILQRPMSMYHSAWVEQAQSYGQVVLCDIDDWYFGLDSRNIAFYANHKSNSKFQNIEHYAETIRKVDAIIASTPYLAERIKKYNDNVFICRNGIDYGRWVRQETSDSWYPDFGWVGAVPWRVGDLEVVKGVVDSYCNKHGLKFRHHGSVLAIYPDGQRMRDVSEKLNFDKLVVLPVKPIMQLPQQYKKFEVGIVPLEMNPFNFSKSWLKGLEYASAGIPFVASPTPEYLALYNEYGIGRIARRPRDWIRHFDELRDPDIRREESIRNYERVAQLDIRKTWTQWGDVLDAVLQPAAT